MSTVLKANLLGHLRESFLQRELSTVSDAQLLTRYLAQREESAFEAMMRRHGAMVFGVCQRVLGNTHDAEDAFQATFLVLARKAMTIVPRERLGSWLHGVAQRTALKARTARTRWVARGQQAMVSPSAAASTDNVWLDLQPILDQELTALADQYRLPIVLCDLEGKSRKDAAGQLGWKEGTLSGRLARGRRLLAARLAHRGVALSALGLAALLTPHALAVPPPAALLASTLKAATLTAAGELTAVTGTVAALTREVLQSMLVQKLKTLSVVLVAALLGMGALLGFSQVWGRDDPEPQVDRERPPERQKPPPAAKSGKIYLHRSLDLAIYDLRGKQFTDLGKLDDEHRLNYQDDSARLSPDGRYLAFGQAEMGHPPSKIQIRDLTSDEAPTVAVSMPGKELSSWSWSPDGKQLSFAVWGDGEDKYHPYVVDVATQKAQQVTLPALRGKGPEGFGATIQAWSPDGLWLVCDKGHFYLMAAHGKEARQVTREVTGCFAGTARFAPDGKKLLFIGCPKDKEYNLSVMDLLVGKTKILGNLTGRWGFTACWAPDSRRIACASMEVDEKYKRAGPFVVDIYDAEGKGRTQRLLENEEGWLSVNDWR